LPTIPLAFEEETEAGMLIISLPFYLAFLWHHTTRSIGSPFVHVKIVYGDDDEKDNDESSDDTVLEASSTSSNGGGSGVKQD
jgi:hypothetical protein